MSEIEKIQEALEIAWEQSNRLQVSGDAVDALATLRAALREAWKNSSKLKDRDELPERKPREVKKVATADA